MQGWEFRRLPPEWAVKAWARLGGWWNVAGEAGSGLRKISWPPEAYPALCSEDDRCRPWLDGRPVTWGDAETPGFWSLCFTTVNPPPPPGYYLVRFPGEAQRFAEWDGDRLWVFLPSGAQTRSPADVKKWVRLKPVDSEPAAPTPDDDAEVTSGAGKVDPRVGHWCKDSYGRKGIVLSAQPGVYLRIISDSDEVLGLRPDAKIVDPPNPIPDACRPVWEAFEALRSATKG